jgi:hypothetical protein
MKRRQCVNLAEAPQGGQWFYQFPTELLRVPHRVTHAIIREIHIGDERNLPSVFSRKSQSTQSQAFHKSNL